MGDANQSTYTEFYWPIPPLTTTGPAPTTTMISVSVVCSILGCMNQPAVLYEGAWLCVAHLLDRRLSFLEERLRKIEERLFPPAGSEGGA